MPIAHAAPGADRPGILRHDADGPVGLEHAELDIADVVETVFANGGVAELLVDALTAHGALKVPALADDDGRLRDQQPVEEAVAVETADAVVQEHQHGDDQQAAQEGGVGPGHRRLHRVRNQQHQHEVVDRELADLALAEEAEGREQSQVDDRRPEDDRPGRSAEPDQVADRDPPL